jgi:transposase
MTEGAEAMSEVQQPLQEPPEPPDQCIYAREFKLEAVQLSERSDKTVAQIARDLGVPERVLYRWRHELREQAERAFPGKGHQSELEDENRRLKRELDLLKQEREVLKKALGIFSRGQP